MALFNIVLRPKLRWTIHNNRNAQESYSQVSKTKMDRVVSNQAIFATFRKSVGILDYSRRNIRGGGKISSRKKLRMTLHSNPYDY